MGFWRFTILDFRPRIQYRVMRIPLWLKVFWTAWVLVWAPAYVREYGPQNFLFFCDIGNVLIGIGLWLESPLIFSWAACGLLLFQALYTIDLTGRNEQKVPTPSFASDPAWSPLMS